MSGGTRKRLSPRAARELALYEEEQARRREVTAEPRVSGNTAAGLHLAARHQAATGRQLRDAAIAQVDANADPSWKDWALDAVQRCCEEGRPFTTDEVWLELSGTESQVSTHERRAMGAVMQRAAKLGLIEPLDEWRQSTRPECHANPKRVWRPRA